MITEINKNKTINTFFASLGIPKKPKNVLTNENLVLNSLMYESNVVTGFTVQKQYFQSAGIILSVDMTYYLRCYELFDFRTEQNQTQNLSSVYLDVLN